VPARGAAVRLIEQSRIGAGASGGVVGALAPHTPDHWTEKKAFQFESLMMAANYWREVGERSGIDPGYARTGRLMPLATPRAVELARARAVSAEEFWRGKATWRVVERADFAPWAPQSRTGLLLHEALSARLYPGRACAALAAALATLGGKIVLGAAEETQGLVVEAPGWRGLPALSQELGLGRPMGGGVKGQALLLEHDARTRPQITGDGLFIVPHCDGITGIGSTSERTFDTPTDTDAQLDALHARALAAVPVMAGARVLARWAGVRPRACSLAPMLGAHPTRPRVFIANGAFKIGFAMAPKVGEVMADLLLDGRDTSPAPFHIEASR